MGFQSDGDTPRMTTEKPLFLAPMARAGDGHGYVNNPVMGIQMEPECIGAAILDSFIESNAFHYTQRHLAAVLEQRILRHQLPAEDRIRDAERRARQTHRDMRSEFRLMRDMLTRARSGGRNTPPKLISRLESIEAQLDGVDISSPRSATFPDGASSS